MIIYLWGDKMKKAVSYMMIGALGVTAYRMYMDNKCIIKSKMKKLKKAGIYACNKVKAIF